ncbi:MAG: hypothetical protein ACREJO_15455 [Phycisphaerales bacterium]
MALSTRSSARDWLLGAATLAAISVVSVSPAAALAAGAGTDVPVAQTTTGALERCEKLLADNKLVECRAALISILRSDSLSAADREKTLSLIERADRRMKILSTDELTLQKAQLALSEGDLRDAERFAMGMSPKAKPELATQADTLLKTVADRKAAVAPMIPGLLVQSVADFQAARYAQAKAGLNAVARAGVVLSTADQRTLDTFMLRITDLERTSGKNFDDAAISAAMLQPGVMRPAQPQTTEPMPSGQQPTPAPEPAPAPAPVEPAPQPVAVAPAPPPAPTPMPQEQLAQIALRAEAQRLIAEGDQLFASGNYAAAASKYEAALGANNRPYLSAAEIAAVEASLATAKVRIGQPGGNIGAAATTDIQLIQNKAKAEFANEIEQATKALARGDTTTARDMAAAAGSTLKRNSDYLTIADQESMAKQVADLKKQIDAKAISNEATAQAEAKANAAKTAEQARLNLAKERQQKIYEAINRARALQQEQKYPEALQVIDQVLFLDPTDPTALLLRDVVHDLMVYKKLADLQRIKSERIQQFTIDDQDAILPPSGLMSYPQDWPVKSYSRSGGGTAYAESPENQKIISALDKTKIRANFSENSMDQVIAYIQRTTNVNVDVDWASLRSLGIDPETPVTLSLASDVSAKVVLERVLNRVARDQHSRPDFAVDGGILTVASPEALRRHKPVAMYNVTDLLLDIPDFSDVPTVDLQAVLQKANGGSSATPFRDALRKGGDDRPDRATRIRKIVDIIERTVDPESWADAGGDVGSIQELNGSLIITTTPKNHREIQGVLAKLREIRSLQINIEARFLLVSQDFFEQVGLNLNVYFNAQNNQVQTAQVLDPSVTAGDFFDFTRTDNALRRVLDSSNYAPNGSVTPVLIPPGTADRAVQNVQPPSRWSPIGAVQNSLGIANGLAQDNSFASQMLRAAPALGVAGQFLDDVQVDFLIRATQADRRNITLTAPRITFTNGQISNIYVANQQAFVSDLTPVVGQSAVGFDPTVGTISPGVVLLVEGVVSADRRYVTMNIDAGVSKLERFDQVTITAVAGGQLVNSAETGTFIQLPLLTVTRVQTTATVPDEGTLLLGGQRIMTELEIESGVPVLSKMPIINRFFTNRVISRQEASLMILVKPTILIQTEQEEKNFPGLNDGLRSGMGG